MSAALCCACQSVGSSAPRLSAETIKHHPKIDLRLLQPQTVATSAPVEPLWVRTPFVATPDSVAFTGQAMARSLDDARRQAARDLVAAVSTFVSVEVEVSAESKESVTVKDGVTVGQELSASETVRTHSAAKLRELTPQAEYWQQITASALTPESTNFRCFVNARVPRSEIMLARVESELRRERQSGRRMLVLLPLKPMATADKAKATEPALSVEQLSAALQEDLGRHLAASPSLFVADQSLVQALAAGRTVESELLTAVRDALLPEWIVGGSAQLHLGRLRVTYTLWGEQGSKVIKTTTVEKPVDELFALEDALAASLTQDLKAKPKSAANEVALLKPPLAATLSYQAGWQAFVAGDNQGAIAALHRALATAPDYAAAALRLGRVYDRLGRYGKVPPLGEAQNGPHEQWPLPCTLTWDELRAGNPDALYAEAQAGMAGSDPSWQNLAVNVDHVFSALRFALKNGAIPRLPGEHTEESSAGAYWLAFALATAQGDAAVANDAALALADLAVRVGRLQDAEALYLYLADNDDPSLQSFAALGRARISVRFGRYYDAEQHLERALALRAMRGEKPYLLEIINEQANVALQRGELALAAERYARAKRLAEELDHRYLRAVLANNLGVLAFVRGEVIVADELFTSAWDLLHELNEAQGQVNAGINLGHAGLVQGDIERAAAYFDEVARVLGVGGNAAGSALWHNHAGLLASRVGQPRAALLALLKAWAIYDGLGQRTMTVRTRNNLAAADFAAFAAALADPGFAPRADATFACLHDAFARLMNQHWGAPVPGLEVLSPWYGDWASPPPLRSETPRAQLLPYLVAAENARTVAGLTP
jgi:tetratricopeptide (TPR) repeat protein